MCASILLKGRSLAWFILKIEECQRLLISDPFNDPNQRYAQGSTQQIVSGVHALDDQDDLWLVKEAHAVIMIMVIVTPPYVLHLNTKGRV